MNLNTLNEFRHEVYSSLTRAAGALFNTVDALVTETTARSFVELSLSPFFERRWPSLYEAFEDGRIDGERLRQVLVAHLPEPVAGRRLLLGIDASDIARPESRTAADRTHLLLHNVPQSRTAPLTFGWQFSTLMVLSNPVSSWGYLLDTQRITSQQTAGEVAATQLRACVALLPPGLRPLLVGDRYYPNAAFVRATADIACGKLLRCTRRRVFYRPAPPPTGKRGAPRKDGDRFACHDASTHGRPSAHWEGAEGNGSRIEVDAWEHMHLRLARDVELTVIRVTRFGASDSKRDPRVSWFVWIDEEPAPLAEIRSYYQRRFGMEHTYRFEKQALLWEKPRLRTPEQFERWTQVVAMSHNLLVLARPLLEAKRQPWESSKRSVTPQQVRRAMAPILATVGTPAPPPNHAENRLDGRWEPRFPRRCAIRWSKKANPRPKSDKNRSNGSRCLFIRSHF